MFCLYSTFNHFIFRDTLCGVMNDANISSNISANVKLYVEFQYYNFIS